MTVRPRGGRDPEGRGRNRGEGFRVSKKTAPNEVWNRVSAVSNSFHTPLVYDLHGVQTVIKAKRD